MEQENEKLVNVRELIKNKQFRIEFFNEFFDLGHKKDLLFVNRLKPSCCPRCGSGHFEYLEKNGDGINLFQCNNCNQRFTVLSDTVYEDIYRPLKEWYGFLDHLFNKKFLDENDELRPLVKKRYCKHFKDLAKILSKYHNSRASFKGTDVAFDLFSYPNEVEELDYLNKPDNLLNYIVAIASDGDRVKLRYVGAGFGYSHSIAWQFNHIISDGGTLIHKPLNNLFELIEQSNLKEKILIGNDEEIANSNNKMKFILKLENEFKKFVNYYERDQVNVILELYFRVFELVARPYISVEEKIRFVMALLFNTYKVKMKDPIFNKSKVTYQTDSATS